eukprot:jgi/Tetstr1/429396/TSEL_019308.t1
MCESNGSEAESAGSEGSGSDEEGGGQKPGRERPAGLSYKLREAPTRATVRKFIGRVAEQLEAWLTHAVGDDDSSQYVYAEGGPRAHSEPLPTVTKERSSSSMAMSMRMELTGRRCLSASHQPKQLQVGRGHGDVVQMGLPYGNLMIKWPSVEDMLKGQGEELAAVGLSTTEDMISSTMDLKLVLQHCAMLLLKEGLIKPGESLSIQLVADATEIFNCLGTGHVAKVKREKHEQTHASLKCKFPEHTFENTSRAAKK